MVAGGCSSGGSKPSAGGAGQRSANACVSAVTKDALPAWARTGFRGDGSGVPHVFSEHGDLVAILFDYPLMASADPNVANKILWASRLPQQPMQPLTIKAVPGGGKLPVEREVPGGPGPSMVNLPKAGCWHLRMNWSGHTDAMALEFG
jgi:hypothetical protein